VVWRRWAASVVAAFAAVVFVVSAAGAAPPDEGNNKTLREKLEAAAKGHVEAQAALENSRKRQLAYKLQLVELDARLKVLQVQVGAVAAESYRMGRLSALTTLLNAADPEDFLERAARLDLMAQRDGTVLRDLVDAFEQSQRAKAGLDAEVRQAAKQVKIMAQRKKDAETALANVGGRPVGGYINPNSPLAKPAPRNDDGSWPKETCTIDDPTTGGCITARTLHALKEAKANGFKRYVSCYRPSGAGEHPKGRACDFAAAPGGFENRSATGGDKTYGDNLASFFIKNAGRLGVLYVIWYRQIWMPGTGWRSYSGGGSPAADHTNHVHLSMI
jgi:hypothetical protein